MKNLTVKISFVLMLLTGCIGQGNWVCDGNCNDGYGIKKWNDGGYEKGRWRNGKLYGWGKEFFGPTSKYAGDTYQGNFNDLYEGYGTYRGKNLDFIHKGNWKNGKPDGYGFSKFGPQSANPGWQYEGNWKNGEKSGYGVLFGGTAGRLAGIRYTGYWLNDKLEGTGKYYWPDGSRYEGRFANDFFDGPATFTFSDGFVFEGNWDRGNNPEFMKVLAWHSKRVNGGDSVLFRFFLNK